ncbi:MAG: hypothetical protein IKF36_03280 [Bacilli bacterium]|nr:hypothetical protein [Bacilli bacterium]
MIIKNFLIRIKILKITYLFIFICLITGLIKELIGITILVLFHELGHFIFSFIFKWNIKEIVLYPFGGFIKYDDLIDKPLLEEFIVTIMGPIFQIITYLVIYYMHNNYYISTHFYNIVKNYHYSMLIFNLIPIIPLDGSKLLNIVLNKVFNYRLSYITSFIISVIFFIIFIIKNNYIFISVFIIFELYLYIKNKNIMFNRFILEKYLYKNKYKKYIKVSGLDKMHRNKKNLIKNKNSYVSENYLIKKVYMDMDKGMDNNS